MIKRCGPYRLNLPSPLTEEDKENLEVMSWAWNSHSWVERNSGYCICKWCGKQHTSEMCIGLDYPLCEKNPCIKRLRSKIIQETELVKQEGTARITTVTSRYKDVYIEVFEDLNDLSVRYRMKEEKT